MSFEFVVSTDFPHTCSQVFIQVLIIMVVAFPDVEVVIIHDAVRPLIDEVVLKNVTKAALEHGVIIN